MSSWPNALRLIGPIEAVSYLALLIAVVSFRVFDATDQTGTFGALHGMVFVAYFVATVQTREALGWTLRHTLWVLAAAIVPTGGFFVGRHLCPTGSEV